MSKLQVPFDTVAVPLTLDPRGGYAMRICPQQILEDDSVYEEVIKEETLPLSVKLLKFCVNAVLAATAKKVAQDCRPRRVGDEIKFAPFIRGKVPGPYSPFDAATCKTAVVPMPMKGVTKRVDLSRVLFVNTKTGLKVVVDRIVYEGCQDSSQIATIMRGKGIVVTGLNLQWLEGDSCTVAWTDAEGAAHTVSIAPTSSSVTEMRFAWPEALADVPAGTELEMRFLTRGGLEDADPQPNRKVVELLEAAPAPTPEFVIHTEECEPGEFTGLGTTVLEGDGIGAFDPDAGDTAKIFYTGNDGARSFDITESLTKVSERKLTSDAAIDDIVVGTDGRIELKLGDRTLTAAFTAVAP